MKKSFFRIFLSVLLVSLLFGISGCNMQNNNTKKPSPDTEQPTSGDSISSADSSLKSTITFTDALGNEVSIENPQKVVSLYGSFAETWMLAGGTLVGVTEDAVTERNLNLDENVRFIGTVKAPNLEEILALEPDFILLSADIATQVDLAPALKETGIPHAYFQVDTFEQYLKMLRLFCDITERDDLYEQNGSDVEQQIEKIIDLIQTEDTPSGLLIRAFSTGAKAKGSDNLAGVIMEDLGVDNIVERHDSLLEDLSMEEIILEDPDFIFVSTMGKEDEALAFLSSGIQSTPAWTELSAVKNGNYHVLPKELFHYKPNARWGESYAYMAKLLYPEKTEAINAVIQTKEK